MTNEPDWHNNPLAGGAAFSKHTPGPWHVGVGGNLHANRVWTADMRPVVNLCPMGPAPADIDPEAQANARLIAAAPDMLRALQQIEREMRAGLGSAFGETREAIRRALATATVVVPHGYRGAEEFAADCGFELVASSAEGKKDA